MSNAPEYTYIGKNGKPILARVLEDQRDELVEALEKHSRWVDGIRGAVESNQVADKDVRGLAISMRDEMRALLAKIKEASNE